MGWRGCRVRPRPKCAAASRQATQRSNWRTELHDRQRPTFRDECGRCGAVRIDAQLVTRAHAGRICRQDGRGIPRGSAGAAERWHVLGEPGDSYSGGGRGWRRKSNGVIEAAGTCLPARRRMDYSEEPDWHSLARSLRPAIRWLVAAAGHHLEQAEPDAGERARPLHQAHEYIFLLTKSERYFYDAEAIKEPASQRRNDCQQAEYRHDRQWTRTGATEYGQCSNGLNSHQPSREARSGS